MPRGRTLAPLALGEDDNAQLLTLANSRSLPHGIVRRAQIVRPAPKARRTPPSPGAFGGIYRRQMAPTLPYAGP